MTDFLITQCDLLRVTGKRVSEIAGLIHANDTVFPSIGDQIWKLETGLMNSLSPDIVTSVTLRVVT